MYEPTSSRTMVNKVKEQPHYKKAGSAVKFLAFSFSLEDKSPVTSLCVEIFSPHISSHVAWY